MPESVYPAEPGLCGVWKERVRQECLPSTCSSAAGLEKSRGRAEVDTSGLECLGLDPTLIASPFLIPGAGEEMSGVPSDAPPVSSFS